MSFGKNLNEMNMHNEELIAFLCEGKGKLVFDTNALFAHLRFSQLCSEAIGK